jgi:thioredoxin 1
LDISALPDRILQRNRASYDKRSPTIKQNMELQMAENISKQTFLEKIYNYEMNKEWKFEGDLPCVVDFWAPWCGPCRMVGPVIEELSKEYAGKVNFYKVNTDEEQELAGAFGIRSIPSLLLVPKDGQPKMAVGALPKNALKEAIEKELLVAGN